MAKLYVFGIGGTGSRVIKSLAMLLASGVDMKEYEVVPIIIDPDDANGDLTRTIDILKNYQLIRNALSFSDAEKNQFFQTEITSITQDFRLVLNDIKNDKFKDYIEYDSLDPNNKALISLLFSEDNLKSDMEVGFKGNPNIGSVVLNQFAQSQDFMNFASSFSQNDRIFIISSIFGGTGAAGFPLLLKNIRNANHNLPTWNLLKDAPIGAITMLPYFGVSSDETNSKIDKSTFISKTKAALSYYEKNISDNKSLNVMYYLGDDFSKDYPNNEGSVLQKNDAHFLELAAALAIRDFAYTPKEAMYSPDGNSITPIYKEFGIKDSVETIIFDNLGVPTQALLKKTLTQYLLFSLYLSNKLSSNLDLNWAEKMKISNFISQPFYANNLIKFNNYYMEWLKEMGNNKRSFAPLNLNAADNNLFELVKGVRPHSKFLESGGKNYDRYNFMLSKKEKELKQTSSIEQKFMDLFFLASNELVKEKFKFQ